VAGSLGLLVGHPLDSLKVALQTGSEAKFAFNWSNIRKLYSGIVPPLLTIGAVSSLNFAIYDNTRRLLFINKLRSGGVKGEEYGICDSPNYLTDDSLGNVAIAGSIAGGIVSLLTSPFIIVKTTQQVRPELSIQEVIKETYAHTNLPAERASMRNFYIGYPSHIFCEGVGRGVYMVIYEGGKRAIAKSNNKSVLEVTVAERMASAFLAGCLCWALIFPADTIRSKIYAHHVLNPLDPETPGSFEMAAKIWKEKGMRGFFKGVSLTVVRAGPVAATVLPIYDYVLEKLVVNELT